MAPYDLSGNDVIVKSITTGSSKANAVSGPSTGISNFSTGLRTIQAVTNTHDTVPTKAQLTTAFGDPTTLGRGFIGTVDDADGNTNGFIVWATDTDFFFIAGTKAS